MKLPRTIALIILFTLATIATSCDNSLGSCTVGDNDGKYCFSITTDDATEDDMKTLCDGLTGDYSEDECNISNAVGTCVYTSGGYKYEQQYGGGYDAATAESACDIIDGDWTAE